MIDYRNPIKCKKYINEKKILKEYYNLPINT